MNNSHCFGVCSVLVCLYPMAFDNFTVDIFCVFQLVTTKLEKGECGENTSIKDQWILQIRVFKQSVCQPLVRIVLHIWVAGKQEILNIRYSLLQANLLHDRLAQILELTIR